MQMDAASGEGGVLANLDYVDNAGTHLLTEIFSDNIESFLSLLSLNLACPHISPEAFEVNIHLEEKQQHCLCL